MILDPQRRLEQRVKVWRCDWCGRFFSERTKDRHRLCNDMANERDSGYRG